MLAEAGFKLIMAASTQRAEYTVLIGRFIEAAQIESPVVNDSNLVSAKAQEKYEEAKEMLLHQKYGRRPRRGLRGHDVLAAHRRPAGVHLLFVRRHDEKWWIFGLQYRLSTALVKSRS